MKKRVLFSGLLLVLAVSAFKVPGTDGSFPFSEDYFKMEGTLVTHPIPHSTDALSSKELLELQDEEGLSLWFARFFYKDICIHGICRMAKFWIFWDGAGDYLGYRLHDNEALSKNEHVNFSRADYFRLDEILADTTSVLKDLEYNDLFTEIQEEDQKKSIFEVDGYTRATSPVLSDHVVKDAVFTCYTMWHTVYGESKSEIEVILSNRIDRYYLAKLFNGNDANQLLALRRVSENPRLFLEHERDILRAINSKNRSNSSKALSLVTADYLSLAENQVKLVNLIDNASTPVTNEVIYKLQSTDSISVAAIALLLDKYIEDKINISTLNLVYGIILTRLEHDSELSRNNGIKNRLIKIANFENDYTKSLTWNILKEFH
jgi:hypothetical protein